VLPESAYFFIPEIPAAAGQPLFELGLELAGKPAK
jgi:hypothetical protein